MTSNLTKKIAVALGMLAFYSGHFSAFGSEIADHQNELQQSLALYHPEVNDLINKLDTRETELKNLLKTPPSGLFMTPYWLDKYKFEMNECNRLKHLIARNAINLSDIYADPLIDDEDFYTLSHHSHHYIPVTNFIYKQLQALRTNIAESIEIGLMNNPTDYDIYNHCVIACRNLDIALACAPEISWVGWIANGDREMFRAKYPNFKWNHKQISDSPHSLR